MLGVAPPRASLEIIYERGVAHDEDALVSEWWVHCRFGDLVARNVADLLRHDGSEPCLY